MRIGVRVFSLSVDEEAYLSIIYGLEKNYSLIVDPRKFDTPLKINARFKNKDAKIRYIELNSSGMAYLEYNGLKKNAEKHLEDFKVLVSSMLGEIQAKEEDFEIVTMELLSRKKPLLLPRDKEELQTFRRLETKNVLSRAQPVKCPRCSQSFLLLYENLIKPEKRVLCSDCMFWFSPKKEKEVYVVNEEYMKVMSGVWNKVQKIINASWREVTRHGLPMIGRGSDANEKKSEKKTSIKKK
jgi:hypothetical protein